MTEPSAETFRIIAADLGIEISERHLESAVQAHLIFRPKLEELRQLKLSYIDCIEPAHVSRWIEDGGNSIPRRKRETP